MANNIPSDEKSVNFKSVLKQTFSDLIKKHVITEQSEKILALEKIDKYAYDYGIFLSRLDYCEGNTAGFKRKIKVIFFMLIVWSFALLLLLYGIIDNKTIGAYIASFGLFFKEEDRINRRNNRSNTMLNTNLE